MSAPTGHPCPYNRSVIKNNLITVDRLKILLSDSKHPWGLFAGWFGKKWSPHPDYWWLIIVISCYVDIWDPSTQHPSFCWWIRMFRESNLYTQVCKHWSERVFRRYGRTSPDNLDCCTVSSVQNISHYSICLNYYQSSFHNECRNPLALSPPEVFLPLQVSQPCCRRVCLTVRISNQKFCLIVS